MILATLALTIAAALPTLPTYSFGTSEWIDGAGMFTYEFPQSQTPLTSVRIAVSMESRSRFTFVANGGTITLEYAGTGLRLWTPADYLQWQRRRPGLEFRPSNIGWDPWILPFPSANPQIDPGTIFRGRAIFGWSHGTWNAEGIGTPRGAHARWPTQWVPWDTYVDIKTQAVWESWTLESPEEISHFVGDGMAVLRFSPTFAYHVTQENPVEIPVPYIPIYFERRILELYITYE